MLHGLASLGPNSLGPLNSLHYSIGPAIAFVVVVGLGFVSRWAMAPTREQRRQRERARARRDFGLLVPVLTANERDEAVRARTLLERHGIRGTVAEEPPGPLRVTADGRTVPQPGGRHQVLVFAADEPQARTLLELGS